MKEPGEWKEEDLQSLIDTGAEEGSQLEFKSAGSLKKTDRDKTEISKDVSSFANSASGLIIYGIDEEPDPPHKASRLSAINAREFSKEWLEQVINSRIHPHIEGLSIYPIDLATGGVCYVVVIPQSFTAHQAHDRRYYRRFNFESVAMEDYEIRQVMNRRQRPEYKVNLLNAIKHEDGQNAIVVRAIVENLGEMIGEKISLVLFAPKDLVSGPVSMGYGPQTIEEILYLGLPGDKTITLSPLTKAGISYRDFRIRLPKPEEGRRFAVFARVFDEYGQAVETKFTISSEDGKVLSEDVRAREKTSY